MWENALHTIEDISEAKYQIELWLLGQTQYYLYKDSQQVVDLQDLKFTVEFGKLIFAYWTNTNAQSWRVTHYHIGTAHLKIAVTLAFIKESHFFELHTSLSTQKFHRKLLHHRYLDDLCHLIKHYSPCLQIEQATIGRQDYYCYHTMIARLVLRDHHGLIAAVALPEYESDNMLLVVQGLKWLLRLQVALLPQVVSRLWIFASGRNIPVLAERLSLIRQEAQTIELFQADISQQTIVAIPLVDQGDLGLRFLKLPKARTATILARDLALQLRRIRMLAPQLIETHLNPAQTRLSLTINGLPFAAVHLNRGTITFGIEHHQKLTPTNELDLVHLVQEILTYRQANSDDKHHSYYRCLPEAWLMAQARRHIDIIDTELQADYLYAQVPAIKQHSGGYIDLLGIRADGQLVVLELKVSEEVSLPFQGLDYWLRVEWYRKRGDFTKRGYFTGIKIKDSPAWVYLVSPQLRFHKDFTLLTEFIDQRVPLYKVAINDQWRKGLKLYERTRLS